MRQSVDAIGRRERNENESEQRRAPLTESEMMPVDDDQSGIRNEFPFFYLKEMALQFQDLGLKYLLKYVKYAYLAKYDLLKFS